MANSFQQIYIHYVFSTKNRKPLIKPVFEKRLWAYIGGIGREKRFPVIICGGMPDHLHLLVSLNASISISKTIKTIKANSSKWINDNFYEQRQFKWQSGYGAFSVSQSGLSSVNKYIQNQKRHHEQLSFKKEFVQLLKRYHIEYDEKYLWD